MAEIWQTTFSNAFFLKKIGWFSFKYHWGLFVGPKWQQSSIGSGNCLTLISSLHEKLWRPCRPEDMQKYLYCMPCKNIQLHVSRVGTNAGLATDILKMESWTHMACTANIAIKDIIRILVSMCKNMRILLMGRRYRERCNVILTNYCPSSGTRKCLICPSTRLLPAWGRGPTNWQQCQSLAHDLFINFMTSQI